MSAVIEIKKDSSNYPRGVRFEVDGAYQTLSVDQAKFVYRRLGQMIELIESEENEPESDEK